MPKTSRRAPRRDRNEKGLVELARSLGAHWNYLEAGQGADGLLTNKYGVMFYVEIKKGVKEELTDAELSLRAEIESRGGKYVVVRGDYDMEHICSLRGWVK